MSAAKNHVVEVVESPAEGLYEGRMRYWASCRTCGFESAWEWSRRDAKVMAETHAGIDFPDRDSRERRHLLWLAIREAVERLQTEPQPFDVPTCNDADVILAAILPLLPAFERDVYGEEYHRCFCKGGVDHVSDL